MKQIQMTIMFLLLSLCSLSAQTSGSGTTNYIPVWTGSTTLGNSIMYQTDSRIGVNTTSPQYALDVSGHINTSRGYLIGENPVLSVPGTLSLALGTNSIPNTMTGTQNVAVGDNALQDVSSGGYNTGIGGFALQMDTSGSDNTAVGDSALEDTSEGAYNTAVGVAALALNDSGSKNTATGYFALTSTSTTSGNVADGYEALYNTSGGFNTAVGYEALLNSTSGGGNVAIGSLAGATFIRPRAENPSSRTEGPEGALREKCGIVVGSPVRL